MNNQQLQKHKESVDAAIAACNNPALLEPIQNSVKQVYQAAAKIDTSKVAAAFQAIATKRDSTQG